jgi:hypothetical protein
MMGIVKQQDAERTVDGGGVRPRKRTPGIGALLALALLLAAETPPEKATSPENGEDPPAAPPLHAVAGTRGYHATSRILLDSDSEEPRLRETVVLFPDRVRRTVRWEKDRARRETTYRFGEHLWRVPPRERVSVELQGDRRDGELLQLELSRAAFFWPEGFAWSEPRQTEEGAERIVSAPVPRTDREKAPRIGTLHATLDATGRPTRIDSRGSGAMVGETLRILAWREVRGRLWPEELELLRGGTRIHRESLISVETRVEFLESFFLPRDRKQSTRATGNASILTLELSPITCRVHPLPEGLGWEEAIERFGEIRRRAAEELGDEGPQIDAVPTFGLDREGRPVEAILRLSKEIVEPPPGWTSLGPRKGKLLLLGGLRAVDRARIALLQGGLPPKARPGRPYARIWGEKRVQIALPYTP